jgi:serine/threonine-protein kinase
MSTPKRKYIEPRIPTPPPGTRPQTTSFGLPDDLATEHVQRLSVFAAVGAGLWSYGLVMDTIVNPLTSLAPTTTMGTAIELAAIAASVAMFLYVRLAKCPLEVKNNAGLVFMVLNAMAVALLNSWARPPMIDRIGQVSWNAVVVLVSSMILSTTPRKMLIASLVAASTDPLGIWIAHLRGIAVPSAFDTFAYFAPNYACAVVATLPSHILQRLSRRLRHAREMGSYQLEQLLGRGGMGEVWRARHRLLARSAAIKLMRPELLGASTEDQARMMVRRFEREALATASLSSPHTIRLFDFGVTADRTFYYVMELLTGRDLDSLVRQFGPVPAERALFLLRQICQSLADAHARGLVHRDVTPSNVYVCRMGLEYDFVKVLDFGLVKFNDAGLTERTLHTSAHTTTGTPAFMAPEVILDGAVDQRADVYAVGCVAYFLLTGQMVFEAQTPMKMFLQHLHATPVAPSTRTEMNIPRDLDELVLACLDKDPTRRPQNAEELLRRLQRCRTRAVWDEHTARTWWEQHLPDLTGPLSIGDAPPSAPSKRPTSSAEWPTRASLQETLSPIDVPSFQA